MERPSPTYVKDHPGNLAYTSGLFSGCPAILAAGLSPQPGRRRVMSLEISFQPIPVLIDGQDNEAKLILTDGQLTGVIVRLDSEIHPPEIRGRWRLEVGFGKCNVHRPPLFKTPGEAGAWVEQLLPADIS